MAYSLGGLTMEEQILRWVEDLDKADINVRQIARRSLISYDGDITELMISIMFEQQGRRSWEAAIILTERRDDRAIGAMIQMLTSRHPVLGQVAAEALTAYGAQYLDTLIGALPNCTYLTQIAIIGALERIGDRRAVPPLLRFLQSVDQQVLLYTTIRTLGVLGDPQAIHTIRNYVNHENGHVAKHARMALQQLEARTD